MPSPGCGSRRSVRFLRRPELAERRRGACRQQRRPGSWTGRWGPQSFPQQNENNAPVPKVTRPARGPSCRVGSRCPFRRDTRKGGSRLPASCNHLARGRRSLAPNTSKHSLHDRRGRLPGVHASIHAQITGKVRHGSPCLYHGSRLCFQRFWKHGSGKKRPVCGFGEESLRLPTAVGCAPSQQARCTLPRNGPISRLHRAEDTFSHPLEAGTAPARRRRTSGAR